MGSEKAVFRLSLFAGALVFILSVFGFVGMLDRPAIPWDELAQMTGIPDEQGLLGAAVRVDGFEIRDPDADFKFITAHHRIGDTVEFVFAEDGRETAVRAALVPFYAGEGFPLVYFLTGAFGFIVGFAVILLRPGDRRARLFFWLSMAFSSAVMISGEWYGVQGRPLALVPGVLFFFAYTLTPVVFLRFVLTFTAREHLPGGRVLFWVSILFGVFFSAVLVASLLLPSIGIFRLKDYFQVFRIYFVAVFILAAAMLFRALRTAPTRERRGQIRWVLIGIIGGLGPFLFLYQLPRALGIGPPISEEAASAFFVLLPLALALAIFKYKLLDVHVIVNKGVVYSLLTIITVGVYLLSIEGLKQLFAVRTATGRTSLAAGAAFIAAVAFAPARAWIQALVDKAFFRRGYDFRNAVRGFTAAAQQAWSAGDVLASFSDTLAGTLPVERVGAFVTAPGSGTPGLALRAGLDDDAVFSLRNASPEQAAGLSPEKLASLGFEIAMPVPLGEGVPPGWLFVGPKRSGLKFSEEDRALLETLAVEAAEALRRVRLQEEVVYERASREKAEDLGRMKTEFISAVSHELRTPMTSLQSISELLKSGKVVDAAKRERLLELMAGECGRLGRYLHNVLDFGRIEQDVKSYDIRETELGPVVSGVAEVVRSAAADDGLELEVALPESPVIVEADPDAVRQALLNLVDNAIKYGAGKKRVSVRLAATEDGAEIAVSDNGIGIAAGDRDRLFRAFYRTPEAVRHDAKGVGLGLMIVKHVMDAHGGAVVIASEPGRGSTFTLKFPRRQRT